MKRIITLCFLAILSLSLFAQEDAALKPEAIQTPLKDVKISKVSVNKFASEIYGTMIGQTKYDLQSNSAVARRLYNGGNGELTAVWTQGFVSPWADRGTGYNSATAGVWGDMPTARIENKKTGWPTIGVTNPGNKEVVIAHNGTTLTKSTRTYHSGSWTQEDITAATSGGTWPRSAVSGNNVYVISYNAEAFTFSLIKSTDGGATFTEANIPGTALGTGGDNYDIYATGSNVAVAIFGTFSDVCVYKSINNGDTWTKFVINDFPNDAWNSSSFEMFDQNSNGVADTVFSSDGTGSVVIDNEGKLHVMFGTLRYFDDGTSTTGTYSYFPNYGEGLFYWNEDMPQGNYTNNPITNDHIQPNFSDEVIFVSEAIDLNGDEEWNVDFSGESPIAGYGCGYSAQPSLAVDAENNIYYTFSAVMEGANYLRPITTLTPVAQQYRHTWTGYISNTGIWSDFFCVTDNEDAGDLRLSENVYGCISTLVDDNVHLMYQFDNEPGTVLDETSDPITDNFMIYKAIPVYEYSCTKVHTYSLPGMSTLVYDNENRTILVKYPFGTDVTNLIATFTLTTDASAEVGTTAQVSGVTANDFTSPVVYTVTNGTLEQDWTVTVEIQPNGISSADASKIEVYPNPTTSFVNVTNANGNTVEIFNIVGQKVLTSKITSDIQSINVTNLSSGSYIMKISNINGLVVNKQIIKK